ncbi:hypothetical protein HYFRA_00012622 [Hymenoscyphus fraxineus]|uniref:NAD-dependent epimerase/dehydratase domain-containing protein n=1 Tax=Hymenoscyphus fraxineus TaxID=746836 RepID=A0A9N9L4E2_9HELO|nr:hypothetical protein HYFRA_00012622 [Hymenoscyphus fraxineus]
MSTKVFITGSTGYIGGCIMEAMVKNPALEITALLRTITEEFTTRYPKVKIVKGDFDNFPVIEAAASNAEVIVHAGDMDHPGCVNAILSGLDARTKRQEKSFLLHLTGTGCLSDERTNPWDGKLNPWTWNDIEHIQKIYDLPEEALHHKIDRQIMDASNEFCKTACICPSDVYGQASGVANRGTFMVPLYVSTAMIRQETFFLGAGENTKDVVHVEDIATLFILLLEHAIRGGGEAQWGKEGFYICLNETPVQIKELAEAITKLGVAQSWLPKDAKPVSWTAEQVGSILPHAPRIARYLWGSNTRAIAARAKALGWKPVQKPFWESLEEDVSIAVATTKEKLAAKARKSKA